MRVVLCAVLVRLSPALAAERIALPIYQGHVEQVIDADTLQVSILVWPTIIVQARVRLAGIDTPESDRSQCSKERDLAVQAIALVQSLLKASAGGVLLQVALSSDKYGRTVVVVITRAGADIGAELLKAGLAKPYSGKGKRPDWCASPAEEKKHLSREGESTYVKR